MAKKKKQVVVEKYAQLVDAGVEAKCLLSRIELRAEEEKRRVGQAAVDRELAALPQETGRPKACPRCGQNARVRRKDVPRTFTSLSGTHTVKRHYHYCEACRAGFFPRDAFLGLPPEGEASIEVEKRLADFLVNDPYETSESRWRFHYAHVPASDNLFRQVAKRLGLKAEEAHPALLQSALLTPSATASDTLYFMSDGGMVPMRPDWAEVKVGTVFRMENHCRSDASTRGVISQARYVAHLGGQEDFVTQMKAAVDIESAVAARRVVYLADGAPENWNLAGRIAPGATQILDWYHALENVMKCGKALLGDDNAQALALWKAGAQSLLAAGALDALVETLMDALGPDTSEEDLGAIEDLIRYVRANQHRMDYVRFRQEGLLIGSGPIESAQRHVIQVRMKRTGQHWGNRGARQMARLRAAYRTAGPERFYDAIHWAHRESLQRAAQLDQFDARRKPPKRRASNR